MPRPRPKLIPPLIWTTADNARAQLGGWGLFEIRLGGARFLEIQRDDLQTAFEDDEQALEHVRYHAQLGCELHQRALALHERDALAIDTWWKRKLQSPVDFSQRRTDETGTTIHVYGGGSLRVVTDYI